MPTPTPRVSVVIPVYQAEQEIARCLASVFNQTYPRDLFEVVIVNNGSTDRTAEVARGFPVRIVDEPRRGVGCARQCGVDQARGELVAFTDSDCIADTRWLEALVARFDREPGLCGVGGYLATHDPQAPIQFYIAEHNLLSQEEALEERAFSAPFIITANALFVRSKIVEAGGFDPRCAISGEDADLCWRMADRGGRLAFAPDALVYHRHRATVRAFCRWMYRYGMGTVYLLKKHRRRYGIGPIFVEREHLQNCLAATWRLLSLRAKGKDKWERRFAYYDFLRLTCFSAGRVVGSLRYGAFIL